MSRFKVGDIIRYPNDPPRSVLAVDETSDYRYYTLSGHLSNSNPISDSFGESRDYCESNYALVIEAPTTGDRITDAHVADMATLSRKLAEKARAKGWCDEYQTIIHSWNDELAVKLEPYPTTSVTTIATIIVTLSRLDEVDGNTTPADVAYNNYWGDDITDGISIIGWNVASVTRDGHSYATV